MSDTDFRLRTIPDAEQLSDEKYEDISYILGETAFNIQLDIYIEKLYEEMPRQIFPTLENFEASLADRKKILSTFLAEETKKIFAELRLEDKVKKTLIEFSDKDNPHFRKDHNFSRIFLPEALIQSALARKSQHIKALLTLSLAHEIFHKYTEHNYPKVHEKSVHANRVQEPDAYQKDHGEIAASLYALKYLLQRSEETRESDPEYSKALADLAEEERSALTERTAHLAPSVKPESK